MLVKWVLDVENELDRVLEVENESEWMLEVKNESRLKTGARCGKRVERGVKQVVLLAKRVLGVKNKSE